MSDEAMFGETTLDGATRTMAAREASWNPLRERRVLGRVEAELDRRRERGGRRRRVQVAVLALAAVVIAVLAWPRSGTEIDDASATALAPESTWPSQADPSQADPSQADPSRMASLPDLPAIPDLSPAAVALVDGSIATLHDGARIGLRTATATAVEIEQSVGRVHYEVRAGLPRRFAVVVDDIRVVVVGTAFWVTREADAVRVTVEHGRVEVHRSAPVTAATDRASSVLVAELGAGDELRVGLGIAAPPAVAAPTSVGAVTSVGAPRTRPRAPALPTKAGPRLDVDALLELADAARGRGDLPAAADALREIVEAHADDPRAYGSAFQLGKVERSRGRHADAARAFAGAARRSPTGALTDDARAEAAISWFDASDVDKAAAAARDYLARHPDGVHAARVTRLLERIP